MATKRLKTDHTYNIKLEIYQITDGDIAKLFSPLGDSIIYEANKLGAIAYV
ncbi:MAG: hypothetical protein H0X31_15765 [Nostocaceae cyanobacterium]|nr:hypothetical protein [Nostocaceae cyanobacterium]